MLLYVEGVAWFRLRGSLALVCLAGACASPDTLAVKVGVAEDALTAEQRLDRLLKIRLGAAMAGVTNGVLFAGIADAETNLAHCWSEATWACEGPSTDACGGGPMIAGAADGACADRQGGLGMFQFDAGDYDDTLAREGDRILTVEGSVAAAVDFMVARLIRSDYVSIDTPEQAIAFMNEVRVDGPTYDGWLTTVTHYYNGCSPEACSVFTKRRDNYAAHTSDMLAEGGEAFWYEAPIDAGTPQPIMPSDDAGVSTDDAGSNLDVDDAASPSDTSEGLFGDGGADAGAGYAGGASCAAHPLDRRMAGSAWWWLALTLPWLRRRSRLAASP